MRVFAVLVFLLLWHGSVLAAPSVYVLDEEKSSVEFYADSTLHAFDGKARRVEGEVWCDVQAQEVKVPILIEVPVLSLDTDNKRRDKKMRQMFDEKQFPTISFQADNIKMLSGNIADSLFCQVEGILKIKGAQKQVSFEVLFSTEGNRILASGAIPININDFGLKPASVLGIIKVDKEVRIEFKTTWRQQ